MSPTSGETAKAIIADGSGPIPQRTLAPLSLEQQPVHGRDRPVHALAGRQSPTEMAGSARHQNPACRARNPSGAEDVQDVEKAQSKKGA